MTKKLICIVCPNGCEMTIEAEADGLKIFGAQCERGREYAKREMTTPMRTISTSVLIENGEYPLASVRLSGPIPREHIYDVMEEIKRLQLKAPTKIGQIVITNVCGCGSDVIVTKNVEQTGKVN